LHVREAGSGPPILLLHGWTCHGGFFRPQFEGLAGEAHLIAPDLPGHGLTGRAEHPLTIEAAADACAALLAERGLADVLVSGWSMGAAVAYAMIARHGTERLSGLVVEDMTPRVLNDADWSLGTRDGLEAGRNAAIIAGMTARWPETAQSIMQGIFAANEEPDAALHAWASKEIAAADPEEMKAMWISLTSQDFRPLLPQIDIPVTLAYGAQSHLYDPRVALWQADQLPRGRAICFERSGHAPHLEEPRAFNAMLTLLRRDP
jgi:pimeloyl-[acyl-carrier protein] methyl ester esterase